MMKFCPGEAKIAVRMPGTRHSDKAASGLKVMACLVEK
jgi:hypothetical protein